MKDATLWYVLSIAIGSPVLLSTITSLLHRAEKRENWARQDKIEARVAAAASAADRARIAAEEKLDGIHVLVNSEKTTSMTAELEANQDIVALLIRLPNPTTQDMKALGVARDRIQVLSEMLAHRLAHLNTPPKGIPPT